MGRLGPRQLDLVRDRVEQLWAAIDRIDPVEPLLRSAGQLAEEHGLRSYDAVHLASLVMIADADTVLLAADGDLVDAARSRRLTTARLS